MREVAVNAIVSRAKDDAARLLHLDSIVVRLGVVIDQCRAKINYGLHSTSAEQFALA